MAPTNAGIQHAQIKVKVFDDVTPDAKDKADTKFSYWSKLYLHDDQGNRECEYGVCFQKVIISRSGYSDRSYLYREVRHAISKALSVPPANLHLLQQGIAWVEDELWAAAHDWEQSHRYLLYYPMELCYLRVDGIFGHRNDALWLTFDEAVALRNKFMSDHDHPTETFDVVTRADHFPTTF